MKGFGCINFEVVFALSFMSAESAFAGNPDLAEKYLNCSAAHMQMAQYAPGQQALEAGTVMFFRLANEQLAKPIELDDVANRSADLQLTLEKMKAAQDRIDFLNRERMACMQLLNEQTSSKGKK